jgi:hypothetical protein
LRDFRIDPQFPGYRGEVLLQHLERDYR